MMETTIAHLRALLKELDGLDLVDVLTGTRQAVARADGISRGVGQEIARARAGRQALTGRVAAGEVGVAEAAQLDGEFAAWLDGDKPARKVADRAAEQLLRDAVEAARSDVLDAHAALSRRAGEAVAVAVEAGARIVDVPAVVAAVRSAVAPRTDRKVLHGAVLATASPQAGEQVRLPEVTLERIQGDAVKMFAWSQATTAHDLFERVHRVAGMLHTVAGGASSTFAGEVDRDVLWLVETKLPRPVWLSVLAGCGYRPGLHVSTRAVSRPWPDGRGRPDRGWQVTIPRVGPNLVRR